MSSFYDPWYKKPGGWLVLVSILAVVVLGGYLVTDYQKVTTDRLHIIGKESVSTQDGHEYRVYTKEDTYVVKDSLLKGRFRTSQVYAGIDPHGVYDCRTFGWRIPFLSEFKNILSCKAVAS